MSEDDDEPAAELPPTPAEPAEVSEPEASDLGPQASGAESPKRRSRRRRAEARTAAARTEEVAGIAEADADRGVDVDVDRGVDVDLDRRVDVDVDGNVDVDRRVDVDVDGNVDVDRRVDVDAGADGAADGDLDADRHVAVDDEVNAAVNVHVAVDDEVNAAVNVNDHVNAEDAEDADDADDAVDPGDEMAADGELSLDADAGDDEVASDLADAPTEVARPVAAALPDPELKALIEALIFAAEKPLTIQRIRQLTRVTDMGRIRALLTEIAADHEHTGIVLQEVSGGFQFRTHTAYSTWVQQLVAGRPVRLSRAQLETLAIVAYRQPITRPEIDEIRGVDSGATLKLLLERSLVRVLGKKEEPGRPILYGTTREFLDFFSLGDLRELPTLREYSELTPESEAAVRRLETMIEEAAADAAADADADAAPVAGTPAADEMVDAIPVETVAEGSGPHPQSETWS